MCWKVKLSTQTGDPTPVINEPRTHNSKPITEISVFTEMRKLRIMDKELKHEVRKLNRDDVRETKFFKSLNPVMQRITLNKANIIAIHNGINVAANVGFKRWEEISQARYANKMIVKELLETDA